MGRHSRRARAPIAADEPLPPQASDRDHEHVDGASARPREPRAPTAPWRAPAAAAQSLRRLDLAERLRHLDALRAVILRRREEIVDRIQRDTGKSRSDALISEIFGVLDNLAWLRSARAARRSPIASSTRRSR